MTIREWWAARGRAVEERGRQAELAHRQKSLANAQSLRGFTDDELISSVGASTAFGYRPDKEMEMQRRLKDSIERLTDEARRARLWALWGTLAIAALTVVLVALTAVLAVKG